MEALKCEIIDSVNLHVQGFNRCRSFNTKQVKLDIIIGDKTFQISALCVPSFAMTLGVEGLEDVVKVFKENGWNLADKNLGGSEVSNFGILVGSDNSHVLPVESFTFRDGNGIKLSCILNSDLGVLLQGSISQMLKNSEFLTNKPD